MRHLFSFTALFLSFCISHLATPLHAQSESAQLLDNGSFENLDPRDNRLPAGWWEYVPRLTATVRTSTDNPLTGTRCASIETTADIPALLVSAPSAPVAPGEDITLKISHGTEGYATDSAGSLAFNACFLNAQNRIIKWDRKTPVPSHNGEWQQTVHTARAPDNAAFVQLQFGLKSARGKTWWDAAEMTTSSPVALRFDIMNYKPQLGETTVPLILLNRVGTSGPRDVEIVSNPGNHKTRLELDEQTTRAVELPYTIGKRGDILLSAEVKDPATGDRLFHTTQTITVPEALVVEPLMPTHFVLGTSSPVEFKYRVHVNERADASSGSLMLAPVIRDSEGKVLPTAKPFHVSEGPYEQTLSIIRSNLNTPKPIQVPAEYKITFYLMRDNEVLAAVSEKWNVVDGRKSRVSVSEDGYPVVDGKEFFPIGLYMATPKRFKEMADAGFNVTQSYPAFAGPGSSNRTAKTFLDQVDAAGLKALAFVSHGPDRLSPAEKLERVRTLKNHPGILCWYQEEVLARGYKPFSYLEEEVAMLRSEAPEHPILQGDQRGESYAVKNNPRFFPDELMDFGIWWWYPTPLRAQPSIENYEGEASGPEKEYKAPKFLVDSGTTKPIWVAMQSYKKANQSDSRFPTPDEYRAQAYIAICHGAKGLMYYTGSGENGNGILSKPEEGNWEYLKKLAGELREMSPVFMSPDASGKSEVLTSGAPISTRLKQTSTGRALIAVNRSILPAKVEIQVPGAKGRILVKFESRAITAKNETLTDNFAPYAVHIYELPQTN